MVNPPWGNLTTEFMVAIIWKPQQKRDKLTYWIQNIVEPVWNSEFMTTLKENFLSNIGTVYEIAESAVWLKACGHKATCIRLKHIKGDKN